MEKRKLDKRFLKYCPGCKMYLPSAWKECSACKKALKSFFLRYYLIEIFKKAIELFKKALSPIVILLLCVAATYGIQVNERARYVNGFNLLINKEFRSGWEEIRAALTKNPLYKYVKSSSERAKETKPEVKKELDAPEVKNEQYALQDIYFDSGNKKNSVLINNKVVFEGGSLGDLKIIKINVDSVDIEIKGEQKNIRFGEIWH